MRSLHIREALAFSRSELFAKISEQPCPIATRCEKLRVHNNAVGCHAFCAVELLVTPLEHLIILSLLFRQRFFQGVHLRKTELIDQHERCCHRPTVICQKQPEQQRKVVTTRSVHN